MYCDFACFTAITHFVANYVKFCIKAMLGGLPDLLQYYIRGGGRPIYYNITRGGGGGSSETPKLYYVIYKQPLTITVDDWHKLER